MSAHQNAKLYNWRENGFEVDFVISSENNILDAEVKSGDEGISHKTFMKIGSVFPNARLILVGKNGIKYDVFMRCNLDDLW